MTKTRLRRASALVHELDLQKEMEGEDFGRHTFSLIKGISYLYFLKDHIKNSNSVFAPPELSRNRFIWMPLLGSVV